MGPAAPDAPQPTQGADRFDWSRACLDSASVPAKRGLGGGTEPNRSKTGTKRHLITDRTGILLATLLTGTNRHDSVAFEALIDAIPPIKRPRGHRRRRPAKLHADKADDIPRCRRALSRRHIRVRIARKGIDAGTRLGRHRWVVERTLSWLHRNRRRTVRYERRADIHQAFLSLSCALNCWNYLPRT